ncbi:MAG TPA: Tim44-like domain-containing protein [Polyangiaceae bacterium]|jgi:hypothetical protein
MIDLHVALELFRPGGGQSYSGGHSSGGSSGGGSGGGGGGALVWLLLDLCIHHPAIGVPILVVVVIVYVVRSRSNDGSRGWASQDLSSVTFEPAYDEPQPVAATMGVPRRALDRIRETDPDFSIVLFEDFLYTLYAEMMRARGQQGAMALSAYLAPSVIASKMQGAVTGIVIGAMRLANVDRTQTVWRVTLDFEANLTEGPQRLYVVDRVTVDRNLGAKSRPPARSRTLDCPNCGAPLHALRGDVCTYCKQQVGMGRFDWTVTAFNRLQSESRGPVLTSNVEEEGTNLPTIVDPMAESELAGLRAKDAAFDWNAFQQRVGLTFNELQVGWSGRDLARVRPFVSDNLFQSQAYWIDLYVQARARNVTDGSKITRIDLANVVRDKWFDAITVRVFATGVDYTIGDDGKLLSGNKSRQRAYSEYWTFIRSAGKTGPTKTTPNCPSCGAPLQINQAGACAYCNVKVTSGEFDWVLSRIEQDDSYTG